MLCEYDSANLAASQYADRLGVGLLNPCMAGDDTNQNSKNMSQHSLLSDASGCRLPPEADAPEAASL